MGISLNGGGSSSVSGSHYHVHKIFLLSNYLLLGAASSCIFLTLSLRLLPSLCGFFLILLHIFTIAGAVSGCTAASSGTNRWEEDGIVILRMADGVNSTAMKRSAKVQEEDKSDWPWPFQV
ncbi:hypothetical protein NE237_014682 [Protea cynaroides]|uniref:Uncharacterized protein n=1 Tax=Protea cynaroides TaxID=273540 RepID=A0A9Q0KCT5_9MAGN|nr:hypothetical protein NE237_014682 [Protea cynaroides]